MNEQLALAIPGWTLSGGMWGNALWRQPCPNVVLSLGGAYGPIEESGGRDDFLQAPVSAAWPVMVRINVAPFWNGWTVDDGECPAAGSEDETIFRPFRCLAEALKFCEGFEPG